MKAWIDLGADVSWYDYKDGNFLHYCCEKNHPALVWALAQYDRRLMLRQNSKGRLPVHLAAGLQSPACLKALIEAGTPVAIEDQLFNRPFHMAVAKGSVEAIRLILQAQNCVPLATQSLPYVNIQNGSHESALHLLVSYSDRYTDETFQQALDLLLAYGADATLTNNRKYTPMRLARELHDDRKLDRNKFEILWEVLSGGVKLSVFTQSTLFARIQATLPPQEAQHLTEALVPVFQSPEPAANPFPIIHQQYIELLKRAATNRYANNQQMVQSFSLMLDELARLIDEQKDYTAALSTVQWNAPQHPTQSPITRAQTPTRMFP